jgi:glucose-6-phosphate dehydrogenase assembly protein OpcA
MEPMAVPDVGAIENQLAEFWREAAADDQAVLRARMLNVVVACEDPSAVNDVSQTVARLSEDLPGRALVVTTTPAVEGGEDRIDGYVSTHCHRGPGGSQVCSEQVTLSATGGASAHLPETVLQLLLEDTPVCTWWRRPALLSDALCLSLARLSDRFVVDSSRLDDPVAAILDLAAIAAEEGWRGSAGDLVWVRSEIWREQVASLFDAMAFRGYLEGITAVRVAAGGPAGPRGVTTAGAYLVAWLAARLGWSYREGKRFTRRDGGNVEIELDHNEEARPGRIASIRIEATDGNRPAIFNVERTAPKEDAITIRIDVEMTCPLPYTKRLTPMSSGELLCGELERDTRDLLFEESIACAAKLLNTR